MRSSRFSSAVVLFRSVETGVGPLAAGLKTSYTGIAQEKLAEVRRRRASIASLEAQAGMEAFCLSVFRMSRCVCGPPIVIVDSCFFRRKAAPLRSISSPGCHLHRPPRRSWDRRCCVQVRKSPRHRLRTPRRQVRTLTPGTAKLCKEDRFRSDLNAFTFKRRTVCRIDSKKNGWDRNQSRKHCGPGSPHKCRKLPNRPAFPAAFPWTRHGIDAQQLRRTGCWCSSAWA
jgi:hypothetical protein